MSTPFDEEMDARIADFFGRDPSKAGRPTTDEKEFRETFKEGVDFQILKRNLPDLLQRLSGEPERDSGGSSEGLPDGFFESVLQGLISERTIEKWKPLIDIFDETFKKTITDYGPPATAITGALAAIWYAEEFVQIPTNAIEKTVIPAVFEEIAIFEERPIFEKQRAPKGFFFPEDIELGPGEVPMIDVQVGTEKVQVGTKQVLVKEKQTIIERVKVPFPPVLHTSLGLLLQILQLVSVITRFIADFAGFGDDIRDFIQVGQNVVAQVAKDTIDFATDPSLDSAQKAKGTVKRNITAAIMKEFLKAMFGSKKENNGDNW